MRFAIATIDRYQIVLDAFVEAGWEPIKIFSTNLLSARDTNAAMLARAERLRVPIQLSRILPADLSDLARDGCVALVVAGHPWRVPDWRKYLPYAINFHPSPLPVARGPYPLCRAIRERRREWGVSCHKIEPDFDTGDILAQTFFPMQENETHETLELKTQLALGPLALRAARELPTLWPAATPQHGGDYWPFDTDAHRTLDFSLTIDEIMLTVRSFGLLECIAPLREGKLYVSRVEAWQQAHRFEPGTVVHRHGEQLIVAASDGFIALLEWSPLSAEARRAQRR
ncbi:Formyl transferase [Pararobbsia alpina]|uniref:formyltransferase family protein n=1 Tax=Pararobbsia alpina TaxID=621374 RepID=UPI0039A404EC